MHRIDAANATVDNRFTLGNPGAGIPPTSWGEDFPNAVQEELCNVVEASGIVLNKLTNTQLLEAIRRLSFSTGDVKFSIKTAADPGWVMCNDGTIGSAASGATTRANADTQALYTLLWTNILDAHAPVTGGRGASAAADFAANKPIALTKMLARALAVAGAPGGFTARALGEALGAEAVTLTTAQTPVKSHAHSIGDPGHKHTLAQSSGAGAGDTMIGGGDNGGFVRNNANIMANAFTGINTTDSVSDPTASPHSNMQPTSFINAMIKL